MAEDPFPRIPEHLAKALEDMTKGWAAQAATIRNQFASAAAVQIAGAHARQFGEINRSLAAQAALIKAQLAPAVAAQVAASARIAETLRPIQAEMRRAFASIDFSWVEEAWQRGLPPNWRGLSSVEIDRVLDLMDETGWCLVWCPRNEIVRRLLEAPDIEACHQLMLASRADLSRDMNECLQGMQHPDSTEYRHATALAIKAFEGGHVEAAQSLAAAVISAIINGGFQLSFVKAKERFQGDPKEASMTAFREQSVFNMVARSLVSYFANAGDPVPPSFSRHATVHSVSDAQYNNANSLASLLLAVAFTKEADLLMQWSDEQESDDEPDQP